MLSQEKIICVFGPTASGKTGLALELARVLPVEIISVDSGMVYRGMDIGTAKPTAAQQALVPHHLIDICDPSEPYSAAKFREDALLKINDIFRRGKIPLLVGGTMLYFKALQQGISALPQADTKTREGIAEEARLEGWDKLHEYLTVIDPKAAAKISPNDAQRIQRALEVYKLTGEAMSDLIAQNPPQPLPYQIVNVVLTPALREKHLQRIEQRLKEMVQIGLVGEVEALMKRGDLHQDLPSMRAVGYRQVCRYLKSEIDYQTMNEQIIIATRQLAKHQLTWLRVNWKEASWFDSDEEQTFASLKNYLLSFL